MSKEPADNKSPTRTVGEELYQIHLTRYQPSPDDFDHDVASSHGGVNKERSMSAGEELWEIHCRRSRERVEEDEETDEQEEDEAVVKKKGKVARMTKKPRTVKGSVRMTPVKIPPTRPTRNLCLRNREIAIA